MSDALLGGRGFTLVREQRVPLPRAEVFRFFSDPRNLEALTPPWLRFQVVGTSTPAIGEGTLIDYRLRIRGIPVRWRSRIRAWDPPRRFVDEQVRGPYRLWVHEHAFEAVGDETLVRDSVRYDVLGGKLIERFFVRPDLERVFDYRQRRLGELIATATGAPMRTSP